MTTIALNPEQERMRGRRRIAGVLLAAVALLLGSAAWLQRAPAVDAQPAIPPLPAGDASLGRGMATAEFSAAFAKQLRDELDRRAAELKSAGARELEVVKAEVAQQTIALRRELDEERARSAALGAAASAAAAGPGGTAAEPLRIGGATPEPHAAGGALLVDTVLAGTNGAAPPLAGNAAAPAGPGEGLTRPVVPPNGFVRGRLLSGMVATHGAQPTAALIRLEGPYRAANGFVADLGGCLLAAEASANLAAGRIEGKPARLTCNFTDGRSQTWDVGGWLVDGGDGIRGIRGVIVSNEESKIALRSFGAALDAAGRVIVQDQMMVQTSPIGAVGTMTGDAGRAVAGGALSGAGAALAEEIQNYYRLFAPSIQVGAQTAVTVVLTNPLELPTEGAHVAGTFTRTSR